MLLASFAINRYLYGLGYLTNSFAEGLTWVTTVKFLEEVVPEHLLGILFTMTPLAGWGASIVSSFSVDLLPSSDSDEQFLLENRTYQILMFMPIFFGVIAIIALFTWLNHESPFFYITHGQKDLAMKTISKYYNT